MGGKHEAGKVFGAAVHVNIHPNEHLSALHFNLFVNLKPIELFWPKQVEDGGRSARTCVQMSSRVVRQFQLLCTNKARIQKYWKISNLKH